MTTETNPIDHLDFPERISDYADPEFQTIPEYIRQTITMAVGAGSTCWENLEGTGVFDDRHARAVADAAVARVMGQIDPGEVGVDPVLRGITALVEQSGTNSRDHGFHDDKPQLEDFADSERGHRAYENALRNFWIAKLALMHEELSEMLGELRSGNSVQGVYYKRGDDLFPEQHYDENGKPTRKPEGFGIELADLMIRGADLAFLTKLPLAELIAIKHEYNKTRPYKHGRTL